MSNDTPIERWIAAIQDGIPVMTLEAEGGFVQFDDHERELAALRERLANSEELAERSTRRLVEMSQPGWIGAFASRDHWQKRATQAERERDEARKGAGLFDYLQNIPAVEAQQYFWNYSSRKERAKAIAADKAELDAAREGK